MKNRQILFTVVSLISIVVLVTCLVIFITPHYRNYVFNSYYREALVIEKQYPLIDIINFGYQKDINTVFLAVSAEKEFFEGQTDYTMVVFYATLRNALGKMVDSKTEMAVILYLAKQPDGTYRIALFEVFDQPQLLKRGLVRVGEVIPSDQTLNPKFVKWEGNPYRK